MAKNRLGQVNDDRDRCEHNSKSWSGGTNYMVLMCIVQKLMQSQRSHAQGTIENLLPRPIANFPKPSVCVLFTKLALLLEDVYDFQIRFKAAATL